MAHATITLALDAMGGDNAPASVIDGAARAAKDHPEIHYLIFGDQKQIDPLLARHPILKSRAKLHHTESVITNDMKAPVALRSGRQSSMRLAINAVRDGQADAVISGGNTGALMAMAKFVFKTLPGIDRPAIISLMPTIRGESAMLDLGANIECDSKNLVQFSIMGLVFSSVLSGVSNPSVGVLNIGSEALKGKQVLQETADLLKAAKLPGRFHGFIEGNDLGAGTVDVVVTDGFTGNVALKTMEGTAHLIATLLRRACSSSLLHKIAALCAWPILKALKQQTDPRRYNGAIFLGLNSICIKSHGGSDKVGFAHAISTAFDLTKHHFSDKICTALEQYQQEVSSS